MENLQLSENKELQHLLSIKGLDKKLIEKIFGKRCACDVKTACDHVNKISKKVKYCLDCKLIINEN